MKCLYLFQFPIFIIYIISPRDTKIANGVTYLNVLSEICEDEKKKV